VENLAVNAQFWRGKKVFITGHTGFKGGWLSLWLQTLGAHVTGYSLAAPTAPSFFEIAQVARGLNSVIGDVRDLARLTAAAAQAAPDVIIHAAAQSLVRPSYDDPVTTYGTNVLGTVNVLEAARTLAGLKAVVIVTSDKCYENSGQSGAHREGDALGGHDPYSNSKACAELVTAAYRSSFFPAGREDAVAVASARAGNVIGGGDWAADRLIPDTIRAYSAGRPVILRYPRATRPWQHVLDPLHGYLQLAEKLCTTPDGYAEPWNFGPARENVATVADVVENVARQWGGGAAWKPDPASHPHETQFLSIDAGKAKTRLGWTPKLDLAQAIDWTVDWYRAWRDGADMRHFSESQLSRYNAIASA
jgi:CDP-glucose 4,6-dehydratase